MNNATPLSPSSNTLLNPTLTAQDAATRPNNQPAATKSEGAAQSKALPALHIHDNIGVCGVRTDTRLLAEVTAAAAAPGRALDMGTGTGYIGLYLAQRGWQVDAVDISPRAVELARANAARNHLPVNVYVSNLFDQTSGRYDVIAFNPPMRPDETEISRILTSLLRRSPAISRLLMRLVGERFETGRTDFLTQVVEEAGRRLTPQGRLVLGISKDEAHFIAALPGVQLQQLIPIPEMERQEIAVYALQEPV